MIGECRVGHPARRVGNLKWDVEQYKKDLPAIEAKEKLRRKEEGLISAKTPPTHVLRGEKNSCSTAERMRKKSLRGGNTFFAMKKPGNISLAKLAK